MATHRVGCINLQSSLDLAAGINFHPLQCPSVNIDDDEPKPQALVGTYLQSIPFQPHDEHIDGTAIPGSSMGLEPLHDMPSGPSSIAPNVVYDVEGAGSARRATPLHETKAA